MKRILLNLLLPITVTMVFTMSGCGGGGGGQPGPNAPNVQERSIATVAKSFSSTTDELDNAIRALQAGDVDGGVNHLALALDDGRKAIEQLTTADRMQAALVQPVVFFGKNDGFLHDFLEGEGPFNRSITIGAFAYQIKFNPDKNTLKISATSVAGSAVIELSSDSVTGYLTLTANIASVDGNINDKYKAVVNPAVLPEVLGWLRSVEISQAEGRVQRLVYKFTPPAGTDLDSYMNTVVPGGSIAIEEFCGSPASLIRSPLNGSTVSGAFLVQVDSSSIDGAVSIRTIILDSSSVFVAGQQGPGTAQIYNVDSTAFPNGNGVYTMTADVLDINDGVIASETITFTVANNATTP